MTLMEVLMSCAIMTIGVVMVATVFPLSTLRVLEASKQTGSTITRFSAEALIDVDPLFINNPDGVGGVFGTSNPGYQVPVYFVDPYGYQTFHRDAGLLAPRNAGPILPSLSPDLRDTWGWLPPGSGVNVPLPRRYTGATLFRNEDINGNGILDFGEDRNGNGILDTPIDTPYALTGNTAGSDAAIARALQLVGQPDNWKLVSEGLADVIVSPSTNITSLTLDNDVDLSTVPTSITTTFAPVIYRAVIFDRLGDNGGARSEIRYLMASSGNSSPPKVFWTEDLNGNATLDAGEDFNGNGLLDAQPPLSARFENGNIGRVRIEQLDEIYTWALTVRRLPSGDSNVDVVVYFRRSFNPEHEYVYPAAFRQFDLGAANGSGNAAPGAPNFDDNGVGGNDDVGEIGYPKKLNLPLAQQSDDVPTTVVRVDFASLPSGADRPAFRKGGFVCDTKNGLWYRIQGLQGETDTTIELILDKFIQQNGTEDLVYPSPLPYPYTPSLQAGEDLNGNGVIDQGGIYWNPTVVNVFSVR